MSSPPVRNRQPASTPSGPRAHVEAWLLDASRQGILRHRSSAGIYRAIWCSYVSWCTSQQPATRPLQATHEELQRFIHSRRGTLDPSGALSDRHTWTVLNLIDRVARHAAQVSDADANPAAAGLIAARPAVRYANATAPGVPEHLSADEARSLVVHLATLRPRSSQNNSEPTPRWQDVRDHAAVALQIGAGLAPGDVRALTLGTVISAGGPSKGVPWKLRVPSDGNTPQRETPIARWAGQLLRHWLTVRADRAIPGDWLFPSTRAGKPWSKMGQYRAAQRVLLRAGIAEADGGSFKLRHTFALRQLRRGRSPAEIAGWMGIARLETLERYRHVLHTPVDIE